MEEKTISCDRIRYFEPNNLFHRGNINGDIKNNNISVNQEELNMYVNLMVKIPSRYNNENNNSSILSGSKIISEVDGEEYSFLTDSFVNASYTEIKNNEIKNRELFGIKSIDVSFDVQFFPQVTIEFTDIRGHSLMSPVEESYTVNKGKMAEEAAGDFFKSIFHFPYPMFSLQLKGFYGPSVSFDLAISEFNSSFDSNTGDFNITVKFIGHMYGLYADIPTSYVLTSPYFDFNGAITDAKKDNNYESINGTYWKQKVNEGIFVFPNYDSDGTVSGGEAIPTYLEFLSKYAALITPNQEKLNNIVGDLDSLSGLREMKQLKDKKSTLLETIDAYMSYKQEIESIGVTSEKGNHVLLCLTDVNLKRYLGDKSEKLKRVKDKAIELGKIGYSEIGEKLLENIGRYKKINEEKFFICLVEGKYIFCDDKPKDEVIKSYGIKEKKDIDRTINNTLKTFANKIKNSSFYIWENENSTGYPQNITWNELNMDKEAEDKNIINIIEKAKDAIDNKINNIKLNVGEDVLIHTKKILGFLPTAENIYRMLFAHLDTFTNSINTAVTSINPNSKTRSSILSLNMNDEYRTDVKYGNTVPPFPMVAKKNNSNQYELVYPGEIDSFINEPEIRLVEMIFNNVKLFTNKYHEALKELEIAEVMESGRDEVNLPIIDFIPLLYTDFFRTGNPYQDVFKYCSSDDYDQKVKSLLGLFAMRIAGYAYTTESSGRSTIRGRVEAFNFYKAFPNLDYNLINKLNSYQFSDFFSALHDDSSNDIFPKNNKLIDENGYYKLLDNRTSKCNIKNNSTKILIMPKSLQDINNLNNIDELNILSDKNDDGGINTCYNGKINNTLRIFPLYGENYNKVMAIIKDKWLESDKLGGDKRREDFFEDYNLYNILIGEVKNENIDYIINFLRDKDYSFESAKDLLMDNIGSNKLPYGNKNDRNLTSKRIVNNYYSRSCKPLTTPIETDSLMALLKIGCALSCKEIALFSLSAVGISDYDYNLDKYDFYPFSVNPIDFKLSWTNLSIKLTKDQADNLKQLFTEWLTGDIKEYKFLKDVASFCELVNYAKNDAHKLFEEALNKLSNYNVITFKIGLNEDGKSKIDRSSFENSFTKFKDVLKELYHYNENSIIDSIAESKDKDVLDTTTNLEIKKSIYYTLKNFYDKWFCTRNIEDFRLPIIKSKKRDNMGPITSPKSENPREFDRMEFVDSYLTDISETMMIDMNSIKSVIDDTLNINGSTTLFETMHNIASKNRCLFLTVPVFNSDIEKVFKTYQIFDGSHNVNVNGSKYVVLFPGDNSKILNLGASSDYLDDSFDIANQWTNEITIDGKMVTAKSGYNFQAFGVTYGMQNQNFFKSININMDNPTPTDYSIANVLKLAEGGKNGDQNTSVFLNNSLYPTLANRTYTCSVEMLGNAAITPLMYFQLNNIPMFRGAYVITNVSHKITPGNFTTTFTGVRIPKYNVKPLSEVLSIDDFINRCGVGDGIEPIDTTKDVDKPNNKSNVIEYETPKIPKAPTVISDTGQTNDDSMEYTFDDITGVTDKQGNRVIYFSEGDNIGSKNFNICQKSLRKFVYDLAKDISNRQISYVELNDLAIMITSTFRTPYYAKSHHTWGFAVDIQGRSIKEQRQRRDYTKQIFEIIISSKDKYKEIVDQIIWETHQVSVLGNQSINDTKTDLPNVIHVSTCNASEINNMGLVDKYNTTHNHKYSETPRHMIFQSYIYGNGKNITIKDDSENQYVKIAKNEWA